MRKGNNPDFVNMARKRRVTIWGMRKNWIVSYDDGWRDVMKEVSRELQMPLDDVVRINTAWWRYVSEMMSRVELPRIRMVYLCTLYPSVRELYGYCNQMGVFIDRLMNGMKVQNMKVGNVGKMSVHLVKLQDTYFRIIDEGGKKNRQGVLPMTDKRRVEIEKFEATRRRQITVRMMEARKMKAQKNKTDDRQK